MALFDSLLSGFKNTQNKQTQSLQSFADSFSQYNSKGNMSKFGTADLAFVSNLPKTTPKATPKVDKTPVPVTEVAKPVTTFAPIADTTARNNFSVAANQIVEKASQKPAEISPRDKTLQDLTSLMEKQEELNKINAEAITVDRAYEKRKRELQKNPEGKSTAQLNNEINQLDFERSQRLADIGIRQAVAQGNVELANRIINDQITAEFEPLKNQIESLKLFNQIYSDDLTAKESKELDAQIRKQQMDYQFQLDSRMLSMKQQYDLQAQGLVEQQAANQKQQEVLTNLSLVNSIVESPLLGQVFGLKNPFTYWTPGSNEQQLKNQVNQLKANLSLENRVKLKGSGQISDFESRTLERAATALGSNLSDKAAKQELRNIRGVFQSAAGLPSTVEIKDPRTGQAQVVQATREGINQAIIDGLIVTYK